MFGSFQKAQGRILVVSDAQDGLAATAIKTFLQAASTPMPVKMCQHKQIPDLDQVGTACLFSSDPAKFAPADSALLTKLAGTLRPGGILSLHLGNLTAAALQDLEFALLMLGLVFGPENTLKAPRSQNMDCVITAQKPLWALGESAPLKKGAAAASELIDEDALISGEAPKPQGEGEGGCSTKPKACANCSCGRKELEEELGDTEAAKKALEKGTVRSACGSCYLGDAFRCATCPYKGQPAFKPGTKVELDTELSNTGQVDMRMQEEEEDAAQIGADGKLVIS